MLTESETLLCKTGHDRSKIALAQNAIKNFPVRAPASWVSRIHQNDLNDPLLKQVLPLIEEDTINKEFSNDPVNDSQSEVIPGLLHKYHGRVLLILTGACPIHCRYCFRKHFPYNGSSIKASTLRQALDYIRQQNEIHEVIYSGGDPLSLTDYKLAKITQKITQIKHIKRLRIHSRIPIVDPERINNETLDWMQAASIKVIMIVHVNHAQELNTEVHECLLKIKQRGIEIMNQSVLLKDINDSVEALKQLSEKLFDFGILPYYLHQLDKVQGASHFAVPDTKAIEIHKELTRVLPGYLVPKLVREIAGENSKTLLF